ncbi:hypothetical protein PHLCEN_2v13031 [Hermanssonia centrifuga]|uniref:Uncharacterized protein n=1 Tax=Hermanssonia centrifuga TaxID=98765 RepID=A0A2R6NGF4_9APHY|nr:hypothetical protein PHLCEN_2v13031 [Hermanssonia centrifuga]
METFWIDINGQNEQFWEQNIYTFRNNLCSQDCFWGEPANIPLNLIKRISDGNAKVTPSLDCDGSSLNQISWYFNVKGSLIDGEFLPIGKRFLRLGI